MQIGVCLLLKQLEKKSGEKLEEKSQVDIYSPLFSLKTSTFSNFQNPNIVNFLLRCFSNPKQALFSLDHFVSVSSHLHHLKYSLLLL